MELDIGGVVESTGWLDGSGSGGACEHEICFFFFVLVMWGCVMQRSWLGGNGAV